jgi:hypothetical protein
MRQSTAIQMDQHIVLFSTTGTSIHPKGDRMKFPKDTWGLADSGPESPSVCQAFLHASPQGIWIVQATSPKKSRWKEWLKQKMGREYWMDMNTPQELKAIA